MDGYFSPDSAIRRIGGESVLMLGGARALLMQVAHPLVAAGVAAHSDFGTSPWRRLARTMTALYTIVLGSREDADRAGAVVRAVHARVHGRIAERMGRFRAGTAYSAADPELQLWVHATLVDTGFAMYETYVRELEPAEREDFVREMALVGEIFGVPAAVLPRTYRQFVDYMDGQVRGRDLCVTPTAHEIAMTVLRPPGPLPVRAALRGVVSATVPLLPERLQDEYGLRVRPRVTSVSSRGVRAVLPVVPRPLRTLRDARARKGLPLQLLEAFAR